MAVDIVSANKDKVTRLKEHELAIQNGEIFFVNGGTEGLISQLLDFTGEEGNRDDLVDAFVYSLRTEAFRFWFSGQS